MVRLSRLAEFPLATCPRLSARSLKAQEPCADRRTVSMNKLTRRDFVKTTAMSAAAIAAYKASIRSAYAFGHSMPLQKFIQPMPMFGAGIPLAQKAPDPTVRGRGLLPADRRCVPAATPSAAPAIATRLYGYADHTGNSQHLGGAVACQTGQAGPLHLHIPRCRQATSSRTTRPSRARETAATGRIGRRSTFTAASYPGPATVGRSTGSALIRRSSAPR